VESTSPVDAVNTGVGGKLGHKHVLSIDSRVVLDAIFAFWLRISHLEVLHAIHGCTHCIELL
jgi:hypothetical protein